MEIIYIQNNGGSMKINAYTVHRYVTAYEGYKKRLVSGYRILSTKTAKKLGGDYKQGDTVALTDSDIKRINNGFNKKK